MQVGNRGGKEGLSLFKERNCSRLVLITLFLSFFPSAQRRSFLFFSFPRPSAPDHLPRSAVVISGVDQRFSGAIFCLLVPSPGVPSPGAIGGGEDLGRSSHVLLLLPANLEALEGTVLVTCDCHLVASRLVSSRLEVSISRLLLHRSCAPLPQAIICMWMTLTGHYGKLGMV